MSWKYEIAVLLPENRVLTTLLNHFLQKPIHVGSKPENYDVQHGGYGYGLSNEEIEKVIEFFAAMSKTVGNKLFKNGESHLTTNESGPSKTSGQLLFGKEKPIEVFEQ